MGQVAQNRVGTLRPLNLMSVPGKSQKGFEQDSKLISLIFLKDHITAVSKTDHEGQE